jgi:hypothetical protein
MSSAVRPEVLRGEVSAGREEQVMAFWAARGALPTEVARRRLAEVVCVLVDGADDVLGVSSAYRDEVALLGGRTFWVYRCLLDPQVGEASETDLLNATFAVLEAEFSAAVDEDGPVGLCILVADPEVLHLRPEVVWTETGLTYAGYGDDGAQVRIRYFDGAKVA